MNRMAACALCLTLTLTGCATGSRPRLDTSPPTGMPRREVMADYVQRIPVGSRVRADLADGRTLRGTLIHAGRESIVVSPRARIPEPLVEVAVDALLAIEVDPPTSTARVIAIGAAAGAAATVGVLLVLYALLSGD